MYRWSSATEPTLTRSELITELAASNPHLLKADVELIVATVFDRITDALVRGDRVELRGFGAFTVKRRNARIGRNPRTGAPVSVDEKARPFFKTGRELRERLNRGGMKPSHATTTAAAQRRQPVRVSATAAPLAYASPFVAAAASSPR